MFCALSEAKKMGTVIISIICALVMWIIGTAMNLKPPGFGTTLAIATMGGFVTST